MAAAADVLALTTQVAVWVDAAALALAPKKSVAVQVFATALTSALVRIRYFLSFQEQPLAQRGIVVESVSLESGSVDE